MTLIAGILGRRKGYPINPSNRDELKRAISRNRDDKVTVFEDDSVILAKVDIGAYGVPAFRVSPSGSVALLAGEPLLSLNTQYSGRGRDEDLGVLHQSWDNDDWAMLSKAEGVFCAAHYARSSDTITLMTDKLGIRPLYYWFDSDYVVFGSTLRIFEDLSFVPKQIDLRGMTELLGFGYSLEKRTPYLGLKVLAAAEVLRISGSSICSQQYWNWGTIPHTDLKEKEKLEKLDQSFKEAVSKRLRQDTITVAFLSGGLDSRCVVAALRERHAQVYTFNFGVPGAQDQVFAAAYARASGTTHFEGSLPVSDPKWSQMISHAWNTKRDMISSLPEHPQLVWSGDGGSVGLGHVYLSRSILNQMRGGKEEAAIETFLNEQSIHVPERLFRRDVAARLRDVLHTGIREELDAVKCEDRGRAFYLFLMLNDQRRHLFNHFEDIDLHRLELQLPFFDSQFLSNILTFPVDDCLNHGLYTSWLKKFPAIVTSVPWQTYPGHDPCPVPAPKEAAYQWGDSKLSRRRRRVAKQELISEVWPILVGDRFPAAVLRKQVLWGATFLWWAGIRDCSSLLSAARTYSRFWDSSFREPAEPS